LNSSTPDLVEAVEKLKPSCVSSVPTLESRIDLSFDVLVDCDVLIGHGQIVMAEKVTNAGRVYSTSQNCCRIAVTESMELPCPTQFAS
jgi:hypothetical protein